jgi:hypothetical protein
MKPITTLLSFLLLTLLALPAARAALTIPSDGSDGVFAPAASVEVDLGQAVTGVWDANNAANAGKGIYDPAKWAVVFKFSSINIPADVTVTFKNHPSRAPVVWLVSGNVTIAGTVDLTGKAGTFEPFGRQVPSEPGPGGFRGGPVSSVGSYGSGHGPGGGSTAINATHLSAYGNSSILPLLGGSGNGSSLSNSGSGGGGSGGILIALALNLSLTGVIDARGAGFPKGGAGAIRIIAEQVTGNGIARADHSIGGGYNGRIRVETPSLSPSLVTNPTTPAVPPNTVDLAIALWNGCG